LHEAVNTISDFYRFLFIKNESICRIALSRHVEAILAQKYHKMLFLTLLSPIFSKIIEQFHFVFSTKKSIRITLSNSYLKSMSGSVIVCRQLRFSLSFLLVLSIFIFLSLSRPRTKTILSLFEPGREK